MSKSKIVNIIFLIAGIAIGVFASQAGIFHVSGESFRTQVSEAPVSETSRLERLIVLDAVFNNQESHYQISPLGELIILNGLFGREDKNRCGQNVSELGELIILQGLFGNDSSTPSATPSRLGQLIALEGLFANKQNCEIVP